MQYIANIKSILLGKRGKLSLLFIAIAAVGLFAVARTNESAQAVTCSGSPAHPQLNLFPITFQSPAEFCHDYAPIDARLATDTGQYSQSQADYNDGLTAHNGDQVYILSYIHNGAENVGVPDADTLAKDVAISTTVPTDTGTDHVITTHFAGSNTNTVTGSFTIHTAADEHLEVVAGSGQMRDFTATQLLQSGFSLGSGETFNVGDMHACFEHSVFIRFTVRVVKNVVNLSNNATCIGSVTLNPANPAAGQAFTGTVSLQNTGTSTWDTSTFGLGSQNPQGNNTWGKTTVGLPRSNIAPNDQITIPISSTVPTANGSYNFAWQMFQNTGSGPVFFGAICQAVINVNTVTPGNATLGIVKEVRDVTAGGSFAHTINSSINNTVEYRIRITNTSSVTATNVIATDVFPSGVSFIPGSTQVSVASSGTLTGGGMSLGNLAPGQTITITFQATVNQSSGSIVNIAAARADNANQVQDQATINVNQVQPNPVVCNPGNQTILVNQTAFFNATGGNGSFSWNANGGSPSFGSGSNFSAVFNNQGNFTVTVNSNGSSASCNVQVNPIVNNQVFCNPSNQTVQVNQTAFFSATGGNGNFTWNANGANSSFGSGSNFSTSYSNQGNFMVTVNSNGQSASCNVQVNPIIVNNQVFCNPGNQTVTVNQTAFFSATGGNGSFSWNANGGNPSTGFGSNFNTVFNNQGNFTVTVFSNGQSASCNVQVNSIINNQFGQLTITKLVRNVTSGNSGFQNSVNANNGDRVEFQVTVQNIGNGSVNDVRVDDALPNGLSFVNSFNGFLGTLNPGQQNTITFQANVNSNGLSSGSCVQNIAGAQGDNVSRVTATANVCVSTVAGQNVNLQFSKRATNDTQNGVDATTSTANRNDVIIYTLTVTNTGNASADNFIVTDDLSGVLPFADMLDNGGGFVNGNTISFPAASIPAGSTLSKTFRVRVKSTLQNNLTFVMRNTYGNTVNINIGSVQGAAIFVAPTTGAAGTSAAVFAGLITLGFLVFRNRRWLKNFIYVA